MTKFKGIGAMAARRLAEQRQPEVDARIAETQEAMLAALARLDWREARRHADQLHAMGFGQRRPMTEQEQAQLHEKVAKLIAARRRLPRLHPREAASRWPSRARPCRARERALELEDELRRLRGRCFVLRGGAEVRVDRVVHQVADAG